MRLDDLVLVVSELATNTVLHGGDGFVSVLVDSRRDGVSVRVYDGVAAPPRLADPIDTAEAGRGLFAEFQISGRTSAHPATMAPGR